VVARRDGRIVGYLAAEESRRRCICQSCRRCFASIPPPQRFPPRSDLRRAIRTRTGRCRSIVPGSAALSLRGGGFFVGAGFGL
jgi:hypothetical protein